MQGNKRKKKPAAASAKASDRQNNLNNNNIPENEPDSNCQVVNSFEPAAIAPSVSGVTDPDCQAHGKLVSKEMPVAPEDAEEYSPPTTQYDWPDWAQEDLKKSGLSAASVEQVGWHPASNGYAIPFYDPTAGLPMLCPDGEPFVRVKRCPNSAMELDGPKYLSPRNGGQHAFVTAAVHQHLIDDPDVDVTLTEGEKKALSATKSGMPMVGLVGNHGWNISGTSDLLPELGIYTPHKRWVLVFDSDGCENPDFDRSAGKLAIALQRFGVQLELVYLPEFPGVAKVGVDDFLQRRNIDELRQYIEANKVVVDPNAHGWPDINSPKLPPLDEFPIEAVPSRIRRTVEEIARCFQVPIDFPVFAVLAAVGGAMGGKLHAVVKKGVTARGNLYVLIFMAPGERKSCVFTFILRPFHQFVEMNAEEWRHGQREVRVYNDRLTKIEKKLSEPDLDEKKRQQYEVRLKFLEGAAPTVICPDLIVTNATEEGLTQRMAMTGERALFFTGEGRDGLQILEGLYSGNGRTENRDSLYLKAYDGDPMTVERVGRHIQLKRPTIAICLCTQLDRLKLLGGNRGLAESGFLSRTMLVLPESLVGTRFYDEEKISSEAEQAYVDLILELLKRSVSQQEDKEMSLDPVAKDLWIAFYNEVEAQLKDEYSDMQYSAIRWPNHALRLALIIAVIEEHNAITEADMCRAIELENRLIQHDRRAQMFVHNNLAPRLQKTVDYIRKHESRQFSAANLRRCLHFKTGDMEGILVELEALGYVRFAYRPQGANVTPVYAANPMIWAAPPDSDQTDGVEPE